MKIFCVGRNYSEHAKELGNEIPDEPVIFIKPSTALYHPEKPFTYPSFTSDLHYEAEIVLHICKDGYQINQTEAESYFDAYTIGIDFTARDIQKKLKEKGLPWEKAKAWDNSAIVGNWFSFPENDKQLPIAFSLKKNEEIVQLGNTKEMIFSFKEVIENISKYFTINKGDLIFTGTPAGVGSCKPGDQLKGLIKENIALDLQVL